MYKGTKFNSKMGDAPGEEYLGIKVKRFRIKCIACNAAISFKTDPKNADYILESGATRNFEMLRKGAHEHGGGAHDDDIALEAAEKAKEDEADGNMNAMKTLEAATLKNKRELEIIDALDQIQAQNLKRERKMASVDAIKHFENAKDVEAENKSRHEDKADDALAKVAFERRRKRIKRVSDSEIEGDSKGTAKPMVDTWGAPSDLGDAYDDITAASRLVVRKKKKKKKKASKNTDAKESRSQPSSSSSLGLFAAYGSDSDEDE